jgi:hypothetical protein
MNRRFELINTQQGLSIGEFPTIELAWAHVLTVKGRMVLWEKWETPAGWMWKQHPLKFIPWKDRMLFEAKKWIKEKRAKWKV